MGKIINASIYSGAILFEISICFICCYFTSIIYIGITAFLIVNFLIVLLARLLIQYYTFLGQTFIYTSITLFEKGKVIAFDLAKELKTINAELKILIGIDKSIYNRYWNNFEELLRLFDNVMKKINIIKKSYDLIHQKGKKLSKSQIAFKRQINNFIELYENSQLGLFMRIKVALNKDEDEQIDSNDIQISNKNERKGLENNNDTNIYQFIKSIIRKVTEEDNNLQELSQFYNFSFVKSISRIILSSEMILKSISIYDNAKWSQMLFKDYLSSFELLKSYFDTRYHNRYTQHTLSSPLFRYLSSIDYVIIKANSSKAKDDIRTLMIVSCMNLAYYEDLSEFNQFNIYLELGIDVLYWNYRGYGYSKGITTINTIKKDIIDIYDEVTQMGKWDHYGAHGMSIGSLPSVYLAANRTLDLLVIDRGFSSINKFIENWNLQPIELFYKLFLIPSSDNTKDYLKATCKKIILCSINDLMITETCNIKTGISNSIIKSFIRLRRILSIECHTHNSFSVKSSELNELLLINDTNDTNPAGVSNNNTEYYSHNETINDILDVLLSTDFQSILVNVFALFFDIIKKVLKDESNIMKASRQDFNIPNDILSQIGSKEAYQLIDDFIISFSYSNSSLKALSLENSTYKVNREIVGGFFSNLFIWQLNKDRMKDKFELEIEKTLGYSLNTFTVMIEYIERIEAPFKNQIRQCYDIFQEIHDNWMSLAVVPSNTGDNDSIDLNNIGNVIKLKCDHGTELNRGELASFKSALKDLSFGVFE